MSASHGGCRAAAQELIDLLRPLTVPDDSGEAARGQHGSDADLLAAVQNLVSALHPTEPLYAALHDGKVHHPLGGGSYAFQYDLAGPLLLALASDEAATPAGENISSEDESLPGAAPVTPPESAATTPSSTAKPTQAVMPTRSIIIHAGAQPNNSPHLGTLIVFGYAFLLAKTLRERLGAHAQDNQPRPSVGVEITFVDTAPVPSSHSEVNGITYQQSYRDVPGALATYMDDYRDALGKMAQWSGVPFQTRFQSDFFAHPAVPGLVAWMVAHRGRLAAQLSPKYSALALRAACPIPGCGLAEKHGRLNEYTTDSITFHCPRHGRHAIRLGEPSEVARLEANAPTRNLVRSMTHVLDGVTHHVRITGADYAGTYQEAFLYRPLAAWAQSTGLCAGRTPHILYAPLVVDWSGAKLSKSLYVREGGYRAMKELGMEGLCSYAKLKSDYGEAGLKLLWAEVEAWFANPHKLFRASYSVEYFRGILQGISWQ